MLIEVLLAVKIGMRLAGGVRDGPGMGMGRMRMGYILRSPRECYSGFRDPFRQMTGNRYRAGKASPPSTKESQRNGIGPPRASSDITGEQEDHR